MQIFKAIFSFIIFGFLSCKTVSVFLNNRNRNSDTVLIGADRKSICIIGGGFGGLYTALNIANKIDKASTDVYLIDPKDNFVFLPLLYELAVGTASQIEVAPTYNSLLAGSNVKFLKTEVSNIDFRNRTLVLKTSSGHNDIPSTLKYDQLVIATGIQPRLDLVDGAKDNTLPFYTVNDAFKLKSKLKDLRSKRGGQGPLSVAVIGGGYSGVEVATNIAQELKTAMVTIIDRNSEVLTRSTGHNRRTAISTIERKGILTAYNTSVKLATSNSLQLINNTSGEEYELPADLIVFTAGTEQSAFIKGLELTKDIYGRILTNKFLQSIDRPEVFAMGDCSFVEGSKNPSTAQVAMQQSYTVSSNVILNIKKLLQSNLDAASTVPRYNEFNFLNLGEMLTLGDTNAAVTSLNGLVALKGPIAAIGRRAIYAVRMPTITQSVKAFVSAASVTTGKLLSSRR